MKMVSKPRRKRSHAMNLLLTPEERVEWQKVADRDGETVACVIRRAMRLYAAGVRFVESQQ
jgi:hypothetical protein